MARITHLSIFDRWGNEVFRVQNTNPNSTETRWDGSARGKPASQGIYVWRADVEFVDGETASRSGSVLLLK